ncbi:MAG TPA: glycosyl hydrolase 53 family protein [Verrucomicrobiae bacterium]|jgi:arabinogalactan endo-1,4-beta-galactosidase|nr:glycosyl hydrolase 53 family protein [Verrucomicrobiae bacterium]
MKWIYLTCLLALTAARADDFATGADLSFLKQAEAHGQIFKDASNAAPGLQIFRHHGYNWIRLRLFVEPVREGLPNDLAYTLASAQEAKRLDYKFLLDLHYASSWADPGKQPTPEQWRNLSHPARVQAVCDYTRDTIAAFRAAGTLPDMVQIGNEITHGMLWPDGKLPQHWDEFADYLQAGIKGLDAGLAGAPRPPVMLHLAEDGKIASTQHFFDKITSYHIPYDVIGLSYYPWWHGTIADLQTNVAFAASHYNKDVIVVETAYYWKPNGETKNRLRPFPETPEGQRDFLAAVADAVRQAPEHHGKGVFWWEPAVTGRLAARGFFDENGNSLPALTVFDNPAGGL